MKNKFLFKKTSVALTALALIVAGTGTLGICVAKASQKTVKSEVKNEEVISLYQKESDDTIKVKKYKVDIDKTEQEDENNVVTEIETCEGVDVYENDDELVIEVPKQVHEQQQNNKSKKYQLKKSNEEIAEEGAEDVAE